MGNSKLRVILTLVDGVLAEGDGISVTLHSRYPVKIEACCTHRGPGMSCIRVEYLLQILFVSNVWMVLVELGVEKSSGG